MHCLILKGAKYLSLQWELVVTHQFWEVSPQRKRAQSQLSSNCIKNPTEFTELNAHKLNMMQRWSTVIH